jgi:hypothetical protein
MITLGSSANVLAGVGFHPNISAFSSKDFLCDFCVWDDVFWIAGWCSPKTVMKHEM